MMIVEKKERYFRCNCCRKIYEMEKLNATNITTNPVEGKIQIGESMPISIIGEYDLCPTCFKNMLESIKPLNDFSVKSCTFCHKEK